MEGRGMTGRPRVSYRTVNLDVKIDDGGLRERHGNSASRFGVIHYPV